MPDSKISLLNPLAAPTNQAAVPAIDPGTNPALNYKMTLAGMQAWLGLGPSAFRLISGTADTPAAADVGKLLACNSASAVTVTANDLGAGVSYSLQQWGAGTVTVVAGAGVTLVSDKATPSYASARPGAPLSVICTGTGTVFVVGNTL